MKKSVKQKVKVFLRNYTVLRRFSEILGRRGGGGVIFADSYRFAYKQEYLS